MKKKKMMELSLFKIPKKKCYKMNFHKSMKIVIFNSKIIPKINLNQMVLIFFIEPYYFKSGAIYEGEW